MRQTFQEQGEEDSFAILFEENQNRQTTNLFY